MTRQTTRMSSRMIAVAAVGMLLISSAATAKPAPHRDLLPNLVALPPLEIYIDDGLQSCTTYEQVFEGASRCLRYDTRVVNLGRGPLELRYRIDDIAGDRRVDQRIYAADGSFHDRFADSYEFHPAHAHFHYSNFAVAQLWRSDAAGHQLDKEPLKVSKKAGFCLYDNQDYWQQSRRHEDARYKYPDACQPSEIDPPNEASEVAGLTPGWGDIYEASLADQYIEVSDVPAGYYVLQITVDPLDTILEAGKPGIQTDNSTFSLILLGGQQTRVVDQWTGKPR